MKPVPLSIEETEELGKLLSSSASDSERSRTQSLMRWHPLPTCIACNSAARENLYRVTTVMRGEWPTLFFFVDGRLIEVVRLGAFSREYSFVQFPPDLEDSRTLIQKRFTAAAISSGDCLGWFEDQSWDQLSPEMQERCMPVFAADNVQSPGLSM